MSTLYFADLWLIWLLGPVFLIWAVTWFVWLRQKPFPGGTLRFSHVANIRSLHAHQTLQWHRAFTALRLVTVGLMVLAMLRPQTGQHLRRTHEQALAIMLAIDTSGSMQALDLDADRPINRRRSRLAVVKDVIVNFVKKRQHDQIGMVVFGGEAFTQCPLTLDHDMLETLLQHVEIGVAGDRTAIGSGLGAAINRLKQTPAKSKIIVLLTDGSNNAGALSPTKAAEIAATLGIKVYTIGAGGRGQAPFLVDTVFGKQVQYGDVDLDETTLQQIADTTHGAYFRAEDSTALAHIYEAIDKLEKTQVPMKLYADYTEHFSWVLLPALFLLLLEHMALGTRLIKVP